MQREEKGRPLGSKAADVSSHGWGDVAWSNQESGRDVTLGARHLLAEGGTDDLSGRRRTAGAPHLGPKPSSFLERRADGNLNLAERQPVCDVAAPLEELVP